MFINSPCALNLKMLSIILGISCGSKGRDESKSLLRCSAGAMFLRNPSSILWL